jgi:hypothetical protein
VAEEGRYRLAPLRDARERDERGKRSNFAAAVGDARHAQARLEAARIRTRQCREALTAAQATRDALLVSGAPVARIAGAEQFVLRRRRELDATLGEELRLEAAHDEVSSEVDVARRALARARADRQVIERHFERWRQTRRNQAERRED